MEKLFDKLHKLQNINSTNSKKQFIKANKDDKLLISTLEFLLNPYKVTNISKKKIDKNVNIKPTRIPSDLNALFTYLHQECSGKDVDIANIQAFINQYKEFEEDIKELVTKSMRLGVQVKLVNQALGYDLIPEFGCMLGESYFKHENKVKGSFILTTKLDGSRIIILKENGKVSCYSRQGQLIEGLDEIVEEVENLNVDNIVIDGELIAIGDFENSADVYKETMKRSRVKGKKTRLKVVAYDYIQDINDFHKGIDNTPCLKRKLTLERLIRNSNCKFIEYLKPLYVGTDKREIMTQLQIAKKNNDEGIMLNLSDARYECKRSRNLLKCKLFKEGDVLVADIVEGEGKLKGTCGALKCKFKYEGGVYDVEVGTGLSDKDRKTIFDNPDIIVGKIITINFFEVSKNSSTGNHSLRFPSFKGLEYIRSDKSSLSETNID